MIIKPDNKTTLQTGVLTVYLRNMHEFATDLYIMSKDMMEFNIPFAVHVAGPGVHHKTTYMGDSPKYVSRIDWYMKVHHSVFNTWHELSWQNLGDDDMELLDHGTTFIESASIKDALTAIENKLNSWVTKLHSERPFRCRVLRISLPYCPEYYGSAFCEKDVFSMVDANE